MICEVDPDRRCYLCGNTQTFVYSAYATGTYTDIDLEELAQRCTKRPETYVETVYRDTRPKVARSAEHTSIERRRHLTRKIRDPPSATLACYLPKGRDLTKVFIFAGIAEQGRMAIPVPQETA